MAVIDQSATWAKVVERLASEADAVLRRNLELLLTHMRAEAALDLPVLMSTVSEAAEYHTYGSDDATDPTGKPAVQRFYEDFAASGAHKLQHELDRLVVDRDCIVTEGTMRMAWPGRVLLAKGIEVDDPSAEYLYQARLAILWPIGPDGLFTGEDSYVAGDGFAGIADRKIDPADVVLFEPAGTSGSV
jgi:SnoaL-like domain